jgi:adenosine deaminase
MFRVAVVVFIVSSALLGQPLVERRLADLKHSPLELYAFLYRMPKGGDLHNHFEGAIYAEAYLKAAAEKHLCIDPVALAIVAPPCTAPRLDASVAQTDNSVRNAMIDALSMRDFVQGKESAHDHFFATFAKFGGMDTSVFLAEIVKRVADQNESYIELQSLYGAGPISELGHAAGLDEDFDVTRRKLETAGLAGQVSALKSRVDAFEQTRRTSLGCDKEPGSAACRVKIGYVYSVLREFPKEMVFAQILGGFALAAADPRVVSINIVQPEDGVTSMTDYHLHMRMIDYAKRLYPKIHITLHAGELAPGLVPPEGLLFHIREAVELGHAERIGHGVDIMYEKDAAGLLKEMHERNVAVEINLTSNDVILGVTGPNHPFPVYRKAGVPVMLSTDDEGVSRSNLTREFQRAVLTYNLTYADLKQLVRNSLEYSFAPGESFWQKPGTFSGAVTACATGRKSVACVDFLSKNEKARLEADLEDRFLEFERSVQ